jgi:outer membrane protein assembly factor BamB
MGHVRDMCMTLAGQIALADSTTGCVHLVSLRDGACLGRLDGGWQTGWHPVSIATAVDGTLWVGDLNGCVSCLAPDGKKRIESWLVTNNALPYALLALPDGSVLAACGGSCIVLRVDRRHGPGWQATHPSQVTVAQYNGSVRSMAFVSPGMLAVLLYQRHDGRHDAVVMLVAWPGGREIRRLDAMGVSPRMFYGAVKLAMTQDGHLLVLHEDGQISVWRPADGGLVTRSRGHAGTGTLSTIAVAADGRIFVASGTGRLTVA